MQSGLGLSELTSYLTDIALNHSTIGISRVKIPAPLVTMQQIMQISIHQNQVYDKDARPELMQYFIEWSEFSNLCISNRIQFTKTFVTLLFFLLCWDIPEEKVRTFAQVLNDMSVILWQDAPLIDKLVCCLYSRYWMYVTQVLRVD